MAKDHYVAQTYLDWFSGPDSKLWIYSKEWGTVKPKSSSQICYEHGGSDNPYLKCERAVEDYLKPFENGWDAAVKLFTSSGEVNIKDYLEAKYIIAGYIPYLRFFTPASIRTQKTNLAAEVKSTFKILNRMGEIPPPPPGYEFLLEDIENNINVTVDGNFPKAIATGTLIHLSERFFKFPWLRVENHSNVSFVTSDNPVCFWYAGNSDIPMTYLPIAPKVGILIKPFVNEEDSKRYDHAADDSAIAKPEFVTQLNELIIKSAEKIVISNDSSDELSAQIAALKNWHYGCELKKIPMPSGEMIISKWGAVEKVG